MRPFHLALLGSALLAVAAPCYAQDPAPSPAPTVAHASRRAVLAYLRAEGFLDSRKRVESADWHADIHEWLVILRHPGGVRSWWLVDATAQHCQGGTCQE